MLAQGVVLLRELGAFGGADKLGVLGGGYSSCGYGSLLITFEVIDQVVNEGSPIAMLDAGRYARGLSVSLIIGAYRQSSRLRLRLRAIRCSRHHLGY